MKKPKPTDAQTHSSKALWDAFNEFESKVDAFCNAQGAGCNYCLLGHRKCQQLKQAKIEISDIIYPTLKKVVMEGAICTHTAK